MSAEVFSSAAVNTDLYSLMNAGELLDSVEYQLQASNAISGGRQNGLIHSLDHRRDGVVPDGLSPLSRGKHRIRDLDIRATYANQQPLAKNKRGTDNPNTLFVLTQNEDRYRAATGSHTLRSLSRLALTMTGVAIEKTNITAKSLVVRNGSKSFEYDEQPFDTLMALRGYDSVAQTKAAARRKKPVSALAQGISDLQEMGLDGKSDVCLVVSDFLDGTQRDSAGEITNFDWAQPLSGLSELLEDRLYVIRLTTPAQQTVPYIRSINTGNKLMTTDTDQHLKFADTYKEMGERKAIKIAEHLQALRVLELSSNDKAPLVSTADFMFGSQD